VFASWSTVAEQGSTVRDEQPGDHLLIVGQGSCSSSP
jgi:hypothetical protein